MEAAHGVKVGARKVRIKRWRSKNAELRRANGIINGQSAGAHSAKVSCRIHAFFD
jgi:hypothetical protein